MTLKPTGTERRAHELLLRQALSRRCCANPLPPLPAPPLPVVPPLHQQVFRLRTDNGECYAYFQAMDGFLRCYLAVLRTATPTALDGKLENAAPQLVGAVYLVITVVQLASLSLVNAVSCLRLRPLHPHLAASAVLAAAHRQPYRLPPHRLRSLLELHQVFRLLMDSAVLQMATPTVLAGPRANAVLHMG